MNLYKLNKKLTIYIEAVKNVVIPDVRELYKEFDYDVMGRTILTYDLTNKEKTYFNKAIKHKKFDSYIGYPSKDCYSQTILDTKRITENRFLVINGNINSNWKIQNKFVDKIIEKFGIKDFVIDVFTVEGEGDYLDRTYIMELNEIHLSSITDEHLKFILENII